MLYENVHARLFHKSCLLTTKPFYVWMLRSRCTSAASWLIRSHQNKFYAKVVGKVWIQCGGVFKLD